MGQLSLPTALRTCQHQHWIGRVCIGQSTARRQTDRHTNTQTQTQLPALPKKTKQYSTLSRINHEARAQTSVFFKATPSVNTNRNRVGSIGCALSQSTEENVKLTLAAAFYLLMMDVFKKVLMHELIFFSFRE